MVLSKSVKSHFVATYIVIFYILDFLQKSLHKAKVINISMREFEEAKWFFVITLQIGSTFVMTSLGCIHNLCEFSLANTVLRFLPGSNQGLVCISKPLPQLPCFSEASGKNPLSGASSSAIALMWWGSNHSTRLCTWPPGCRPLWAYFWMSHLVATLGSNPVINDALLQYKYSK